MIGIIPVRGFLHKWAQWLASYTSYHNVVVVHWEPLSPPFPPAIVLTNGSTVWYLHSLCYHLIKRFSLLDFFWYFTWWAPEVQCESSSQLIKQFTTLYLGCCLFLPFITFLLCLLNNSIDRAWNKPRYTCRWPLPDLPQVKAIHTDTGNAASAVDFTIALDFKEE